MSRGSGGERRVRGTMAAAHESRQLEINHGPRPPFPNDSTILDMLQQHVHATPAALALVLPEGERVDGVRREVPYSEMWSHVTQIAQELVRAGARSGSRWVMIVLPEGLAQVCAVWGVLMAGCGYVPIDAETQAARLRTLAKETQPSAVIGEVGDTPLAALAAELGLPMGTFPTSVADGLVVVRGGQDGGALMLGKSTVDDNALLLYSSGSTGVPKGIVYDHRWLAGGSWFICQDLELNPSSRCLLRCSYVWSVSLYDLFPANMVGGCLFIPPPGGHKNVQYISETIEKESIHAVVIQPTLLNLLLDEHKGASGSYPLRSLQHVVSSGEKLFTSTAEAFLATPGLHAKLWNMYGATEAGCTYFACQKGDEARLRDYPDGVPAGVPQSYVDVFIMEETTGGDLEDPLSPVKTGQVGEICFGGGGPAGFLAQGYWRRQDLTDQVFIDTRSYGRIYRTGDAGQWRNGEVIVCGRLDRQVKVHGVRTQPESIEAVLKRYVVGGDMPIKACLVVPTQHQPVELVAFFETGNIDETVDISAVRSFLRQELGRLYVPKHIVHLVEGLPRTASGKPDQNTLKQMASEQEDHEPATAAISSNEPNGTGTTSLSKVLDYAKLEPCGRQSWHVDLRQPVWKPLADHRYRGEPIFPGAGYVALAAEVCQANAWVSWELQDVIFSKALPLEDGGAPRPLRVTATPIETGVDILIASWSPSGEWVTHCTCHGVRLDDAHGVIISDMHSGIGATHQAYPVEQLYAQMADGGFDYGHRFQALSSVHLQSPNSGIGAVAHRESPFLLDFVTVDACFHIAPLVSALGFQGAPVRINCVQFYAQCPEKSVDVNVTADESTSLLDFHIFSDVPLFTLKGLELRPFDVLPPEPLRVQHRNYAPSSAENMAAIPRVIALGTCASSHAGALARQLDTPEVCTWSGEPVERIPLRSVVLVVGSEEESIPGVETLLLALQQELPWTGRVWLMVVGDGNENWQSRGRAWSVSLPALMLSVLSVQTVDDRCIAPLLDISAPPYINNGRTWFLDYPDEGTPRASQMCGTTLQPGSHVLVLAAEINPLVTAMLNAIEKVGTTPKLLLPGDEAPAELGKATVMLCSVGPGHVDSFEPICAGSGSCVTLASMDVLLPSVHSCRASPSAQATTLSWERAQAGHASWVVFVPPLFDGHWFEPPAPAGFHRCSVDKMVEALADMTEATDYIFGMPPPGAILKHYSRVASVSDIVVRGEDDVRLFLLQELAEQLKVDLSQLVTDMGIDDLGVTSLLSLRLSQRLRRFLGRDFSPFVLSKNPTISELAQQLSQGELDVVQRQATRGRVLCLHGYRTSSTVLQQQISVQSPLGTEILERLGYQMVVPNGPHKTSGAAQFAEGLDQNDSYGWWTYPDEDGGNDQLPIGLNESIAYIEDLLGNEQNSNRNEKGSDNQPASTAVVGIIGFSQGGAMAAQLANRLRAKWVLLFSPIYAAGYQAQCDCPTLVVYDRADEVFSATEQLISELQISRDRSGKSSIISPQRLEHNEGHRIPVGQEFYGPVTEFVDKYTPP